MGNRFDYNEEEVLKILSDATKRKNQLLTLIKLTYYQKEKMKF